jgi:hypothetical protein
MPKFRVVRNRAQAGGTEEAASDAKPQTQPKASGGGGWWLLLLGVAGGAFGYHYLLRNAQGFMGGGMNLAGSQPQAQPQVSGARARFLAATAAPQTVQYVPVAQPMAQPMAQPVIMEEIDVLE